MANNPEKYLKSLGSGKKIFIPIAIGLIVIIYMLYKEININDLKKVTFTSMSIFWIFAAFICMLVRDLGYIIRLKILAGGRLNWKQSFNLIMLWEFTSAVTPGAIGGTAIAIVYVNKEGISLGRSSAIIMATSFLDELYFILTFPLLFIVISGSQLFSIDGTWMTESFFNEFFYFAIIGYGLKLIYTCFLSYGLFINPRGLKWLLLRIFKLPIIRKWRYNVHTTGTEVIRASKELKGKSFIFWVKIFFATLFSWTARYWVVNCLIVAFFVAPTFKEHILVFARQFVMWIMMLISPTPGGSGFAEFVFTKYLHEFIPFGLAASMALLWRLVSYYPYLFIGAIILPRWIKKHFL